MIDLSSAKALALRPLPPSPLQVTIVVCPLPPVFKYRGLHLGHSTRRVGGWGYGIGLLINFTDYKYSCADINIELFLDVFYAFATGVFSALLLISSFYRLGLVLMGCHQQISAFHPPQSAS
jgi:hypothetical protein